MAVRLVHVLLISLLLYDFAAGDYCRNENISSIQFCQGGIISGSKVYINGTSVKTKEEIKDRECVCYLEQIRNRDIRVNGGGTCVYCGLQVRVGDVLFRYNSLASATYGWGWIVLNDTKFTMTLGLDRSSDRLNSAFCITIEENQQDSSVVLNLTCEELVATSSTEISTSPNVITTPPTMVPDTTKRTSPTSTWTAKPPTIQTTMVPDITKSMSPLSTETAVPARIETTNPTVVIAGNTNGTHGPNANNTSRVTTTTGQDPGKPKIDTQKEVIIPAAAGGGAGVLVILIIIIVVCCLRKKRKHAEDPIDMKESYRSDAIMTDNVAYGMYIDTHTNPVPQVQAHITGDVYAVVNKEGTSNVRPSVEVPRMQVDETGDVYAIVNKTTKRDIPSIEHSREKTDKSHIQTKVENNNVTVDITPSTDYADISNV
ncbi:hypothetical protein ACJMK2_024242 [Sinanodonta woodiana]|uniref:Uncharacterized protein n=1 Tax=Sinanodonta woodiana TaxID=1069815 RepID=A0ABD3T8C3_SINWO